MKKIVLLLLCSLSCALVSAQQTNEFKLAFGSCANQSSPLRIYDVVVKHQPNLFVFLGDNVYGDTDIYDSLMAIYQRMGQKPTFRNLKAHVPIIATWDDHYYGRNDAGRHFAFKHESKRAFMNFFDLNDSAQLKSHDGIYQVYYYTHQGKTIQVILLDVRSFRDNLKPYSGEKKCSLRYTYKKYYSPQTSPDSTMLGQQQWEWLELQLRKPADLRIIGSGSQFGITWNGYESWANFPHEQKRMYELIKRTRASGVVFISGDVHYAEISKVVEPGLYPIYDVTASGLSSTWEFATPNENRIAGPVMQNHFGLLSIDFNAAQPYVRMEIWDKDNKKCVTITETIQNLSIR